MDHDVCALREERLSVQVAGSWCSPPSGGLAHSVELGCARWAPIQAMVSPEAVSRGGEPETSTPRPLSSAFPEGPLRPCEPRADEVPGLCMSLGKEATLTRGL